MNRLTAYLSGQEVASCMIATGSQGWNARKVPGTFARAALEQGWSLSVATSRGLKPRRLIERRGVFYTRELETV
jgi:hypothetical protein